MRKSTARQRYVTGAITAGVVAFFAVASTATASCGEVISDYVPGFHAIRCSYESGAEETWTVPAKITKPRFEVRGADDAIGGNGGFLSAKVPVESGETLDLKMGGPGAASSVSRSGTPLLIAGGGDGSEPNYVDPAAKTLEAEEPGQPLGSTIRNGSAYIEWYDAREPFELVDPLPYVVVDIFGSEGVGFSYTGENQNWIVPEGVEHAIFELFGGPGDSGEPRGHVVAGLDVKPGEIFHISVGGNGEDTTVIRDGSFDIAMAAGGDTERPNYLPTGASLAEEFWEGGGSESEPRNGYAIVHFWRSKNDWPAKATPSSEVEANLIQIVNCKALKPVARVTRSQGRHKHARGTMRRHAQVRREHRRAVDQVCATRLASGPLGSVNSTGSWVARLKRGHVLYGTGRARVGRSHARLALRPIRQISPGMYKLVLSRGKRRLDQIVAVR